jgi:hypothetical protein
VTVKGGRLSGVSVLQDPNGNPRDQQINAYALPILVQESLDAQGRHADDRGRAADHRRALEATDFCLSAGGDNQVTLESLDHG